MRLSVDKGGSRLEAIAEGDKLRKAWSGQLTVFPYWKANSAPS